MSCAQTKVMCGIEGHQSMTGHGILVCRTRQGGAYTNLPTGSTVRAAGSGGGYLLPGP